MKKKAKGFDELFGHTRKRIKERYGIVIDEIQYRQLSKLIRRCSQIAKFIKRSSNTRTIYEIPFMEKILLVVYDTNRHGIITALPNEKRMDNILSSREAGPTEAESL
jgi:hypothetical protein